ncbi:hypothetical protein CK203_079006 [Vitis vinifera]|uniref:Uncharacterized protein n=1 Tax=Vitis vinifera TaxID=29760 RepID=A0A438D9Y2_VITVI|nr:hypothetical protein CK203_079006 [Vitis vinifera]
MVLVQISEAESSLRHQEMAASAKHQHHHSLAEESVCDKDSDSENGSTSTSCKSLTEKSSLKILIGESAKKTATSGSFAEKRTGVEKGDQSLPLTRNLRLRNAAGRCRARSEIDSQLLKGTGQVKSSRSSKTARNKPAVNKKKPKKFSVALSQEEIADDIFAMTGSKPSRRPIKRDKKVQQTVDNISPGFWLHTITPSSYNLKVVIFTILIGRTPGGIRFLLDQS